MVLTGTESNHFGHQLYNNSGFEIYNEQVTSDATINICSLVVF